MGENGPLNPIRGLEEIKLSNQEKPVDQIGENSVDLKKLPIEMEDESNPLKLVDPIKDNSDPSILSEKSATVVTEVFSEQEDNKSDDITETQEEKPDDKKLKEEIKKSESVIESQQIESEKIEEEKSLEKELAEKWVKKFLPFGVLDAYALFSEKSKKSNEEKRKNKKYNEALKKAKKNYIPDLIKRLDTPLKSGVLSMDSSEDEVKNKILEIVHSSWHAKNLETAIKQYKYSKEENVDKGIVDSSPENSTEKSSIKKDVPVIGDIAEKLGKEDVHKKLEIKSRSEKENILEVPKTEEEFFKRYEIKGSYLNPEDGSEFQILDFNPDKKEVVIYKHKSFVYDKETESWEAPEQRGGEETLKYDDFVKLIGKHISDTESSNEYFQEQQVEAEKEKTKEKEKLGGIYVKDNGDYFKQKEYQKRKGGKYTSKEGIIELEFDPKIRGNKRFSNIKNLNEFIEKEGFEFYKDEEALKDSFWEEFGKFEDSEKLKIISLNYNSEKGRYLAKIQEKEKELRLVTVKELREAIEDFSKKDLKKMTKDVEKNESEKSEEELLEEKFTRDELNFLKDAMVGLVEDYKKELEEYLEKQRSILGDNILEGVRKKYLEYFWLVKLPENVDLIGDIVSLDKKYDIIKYLNLKEKQN